MKLFKPEGFSMPLYIGDKITTIVTENDQLIIGDPGYGVDSQPIVEFYADALFEKREKYSHPPKYRVYKPSGSFFELESQEAADRVVKRETDLGNDVELKIIESDSDENLVPVSFYGSYLKVPLPANTESVDVFELFREKYEELEQYPFYDGFGYFIQFKDLDSLGGKYFERQIIEIPVDTATIMVCDAARAEKYEWSTENQRAEFDGKPVEMTKVRLQQGRFLPDGPVEIFGDEEVRGVAVSTHMDGPFDIHAVYVGNKRNASLVGIYIPLSFYEPDIDKGSILASRWATAESGDADAQYELACSILKWGKMSDVGGDEATNWLILAAENGHTNAKALLGNLYYSGSNQVEPDQVEAVKWFRAAAEDGDSSAQGMLGSFYLSGECVDQDDQEAAKWFGASAEQGDPNGLYDLGQCYEHGAGVEGNKEKAFRCYEKSYELDEESPAVVALARCYTGGIGVEKNIDKAIELLRKSAETGSSEAQWRLGFIYSDTEKFGVTDLHEAVKWFQLAAEQGDETGLIWLAGAYHFGNHLKQNFEEAAKWFHELAEIESERSGWAAMTLAEYYLEGKGVDQSYDEARKWFFKAQSEDTESWECFLWMFDFVKSQDVMEWVQAGVDRGDPEFVHALGDCYWTGTGVEVDNKLALKLALEAAKSGYEPAKDSVFGILEYLSIDETFSLDEPEEFDELEKYLSSLAERGEAKSAFELGNLYMADWHGKENPELAFKSFKTAAEQPDGVPSWTYQLGYCYYEGYGVKENPEEAFKWFLQSAKRGFVLAMEVVSECYREGSGVEKNLEEAEKWLTRYEEKTASFEDKEGDDESDDD